MKEYTYTRAEKLYLNPDGTLNYFQFGASNHAIPSVNNFHVVKKMAELGCEPAVSAVRKLEAMTSRERSESGIYWKMQNEYETYFVAAKEQLLGIKALPKITVIFSAKVSRHSVSRERCFRSMCAYHKNGVIKRIPYTNELMVINMTVIK
jgi:hypothetical protein